MIYSSKRSVLYQE